MKQLNNDTIKNCIFCQIVAGQIPCYKVYEDRDFLGFLDINPLNPGHTLVVSKKHYLWVVDVPQFGRYWEVAGKVARAIRDALRTDSINFITLGYEVNHAHIHVIPRFDNDDLGGTVDWSRRKKLPADEMTKIAQQIYQQLK